MRRQGADSEEAKDLTQGFFALLLERRDLNSVRKEKGRLRSYLLTSLKHFLTNEHNRAMAIKRGDGQRLIPLEDLHEREAVGFGTTGTLTAEQIYERNWALALLDQVLTRLGDEHRANGPASAGLFDRLQELLTDESDRPAHCSLPPLCNWDNTRPAMVRARKRSGRAAKARTRKAQAELGLTSDF